MPRPRANILLIGSAVALALALPAIGQDAPESILPPGFGDPPPPKGKEKDAPSEKGEPKTPVQRQEERVRQSLDAVRQSIDRMNDSIASLGAGEESPTEEGEALEPPPPPPEMPAAARRSAAIVGAIGQAEWGIAPDGFAGLNGGVATSLMKDMQAPLPSRWASILLRRTLLSRTPAPGGIKPADWVAERAWLLVRMGEADAGRSLVQGVDVDDFTPRMYAVGLQSALASADPAAICPLLATGRADSKDASWRLGRAVCASLEGEPARASALYDQARRASGTAPIDLSLTQKVIGAGPNARRSAQVQWDNVDGINPWRFAMAATAGLEIPTNLMSSAAPDIRAWYARAPMVQVESRLASADTAAALGVFSNAALVEMYSLVGDRTDRSEWQGTLPGRLRACYVGEPGDRAAAMRGLWDENAANLYPRLILTAAAAARLQPSEALAGDAEHLLMAMFAAGFDKEAARWTPIVNAMSGAAQQRAWALLAVGAPQPAVEIDAGAVNDFAGADNSIEQRRTKALIAALAGLGRIDAETASDLAEDYEIKLGTRNLWAAMIDRAAAVGKPGTVALLMGTGMQTGGWAGVPPEHLYHILRALRMTGRDFEARMIAAEAITRL